jgi:hypothetical protein
MGRFTAGGFNALLNGKILKSEDPSRPLDLPRK